MGMMIDPYRFAVAGGPSSFTQFSATEQSTSTFQAWVDLVTLSISAGSLTPNTDYLILWCCEGKHSAVSALTGARLFQDGAAELVRQVIAPLAINLPEDYYSMGGIERLQVGSTPANVEYKLQVANLSGTGTAAAKRARVTLIPMGSDDFYSVSAGRQTTNLTTFQTAASLVFTPATSGDYLIIATAQGDGGGTVQPRFRVSYSGGDTGDVASNQGSSSERRPLAFLIRRNSLSGSQTINWDYRSANTGARVGISEMRFAAIRIDARDDFNMTTLGTTSTGSSGSYASALSQTFTPTAAEHISIAAWRMTGSSTTLSNQSQYVDGATVTNEHIFLPRNANADYRYGFTHNVETYTATSRTQSIDRLSEAANTTSITDTAAIACFEF
jgi:hypothetical protein